MRMLYDVFNVELHSYYVIRYINEEYRQDCDIHPTVI